MKKWTWLIFSLCCFAVFCMAPVSAQSFDYMKDVDTVTANPQKAYTVYVGMPSADFRANFRNLKGWTYRGDSFFDKDGSVSPYSVLKNIRKGDSVAETINVISTAGTRSPRTIETYNNCFYTNSYQTARQIYDRAVNNFRYNLGRPTPNKLRNLAGVSWTLSPQNLRVFVSLEEITAGEQSKYFHAKYRTRIGRVKNKLF